MSIVDNSVSDSNNPYEILGVSPLDDINTIKTKYKKLCKKYHPDVAGAEYTEVFVKIKDAWDYIQKNVGSSNQNTHYWVHSSLFTIKYKE